MVNHPHRPKACHIHISDETWRCLHQATSIPHDLTMLVQLMRDRRASASNILATLSDIKAKAEYIVAFCDRALPGEG